MAVHPFARNCEEVIARLREILAGLKRTKKAATTAGDRASKPRGKMSDLLAIWLLPSWEMEQQAQVEGSERGLNTNPAKGRRGGSRPRKPNTGDPTRDALLWAYQSAMARCRDKNVKDNERYWRCRAKRGNTAASCRDLFVPMVCPEGIAAREALDGYMKSKADSNSGGGGGGGF